MDGECETDANASRERIEAAKENRRFFSNSGKPDRERWCVLRFLKHLQIPFDDGEVLVGREEPVDMAFREARFQVKEILDPDRRRTDEYREAEEKARRGDEMLDVCEPHTHMPVSLVEVVDQVIQEAARWSGKYASGEYLQLDLLIYYNVQYRHVCGDAVPERITQNADVSKWRSVAVVSDDFAFVLSALPSAPEFVRSAQGPVHRDGIDSFKHFDL